MRKLFAVLLLAALPVAADDASFHMMQSGEKYGLTPLSDHGIDGRGQIIAVLDTGADWDSCFFAEPDSAPPPINTGTPGNGLQSSNVDLTRRKIVAYDFLYSCDQYPGAAGCDDPANLQAYDNALHGTIAAAVAAGDSHVAGYHDAPDGIAMGAKLIVQDGGFIGGDSCSQRPGFGCPVQILPILDQAYAQGARIHSDSWGDRQSTPPPLTPPVANYSASTRDVDAFVWSHPDMLLVFDAGNSGTSSEPPPYSVAAPGCAKNVIQAGGTRAPNLMNDDVLSWFSLTGPTRDGRIKPDLVAPAMVLSATSDGNVGTGNCNTSTYSGTSWSAPSIAGAAALVRQYYIDGFYPTGVPTPSNGIVPSAALLKATLIASARAVPRAGTDGLSIAKPVPSYEQGFGFPVLDDALYFPGDAAKTRVVDVPLERGLTAGATATFRFVVHEGTPLKAVLVWTDPAGTPRSASDPTRELVNDLDLRVSAPSGALSLGNESLHPGNADRLNNVEVVAIPAPAGGTYTISVTAASLGSGPRQGYALVVTGDLQDVPSQPSRLRVARH